MSTRAQILITAVDQTREALNSARTGLQGLSDVAGRVSRVLAGLGVAISAAGFTRMIRESINAADAMAKLSQRTGVSVENLSTLAPITGLAATSMEALSKGMARLSLAMNEADGGSKTHKAMFAQLGIAYTDTAGNLRSVDTVLLDLAAVFKTMPDGPEKAAIAMELFGRSGTELIPFLNLGRDGIEALQAKMRDLGMEMSGHTARAGESFNDAMAGVGFAIEGLVNRALIAMTPLMIVATEALVWLAHNLDELLAGLKLVAEVGLAMLITRSIPAAILAFKALGVAAVGAAQSIAAAWAVATMNIGTAAAALGKLQIAFLALSAFLVGWEIGTWLSARFTIVRQAGIFMVEGLVTGFEYLRFGWEAFQALFTNDTLEAAAQRHEARLTAIQNVFRAMYADAERGSSAAAGAIDTAATASEALAQQLAQARQQTQASVQASLAALTETVTALQTEITRVDAAIGTSRETVNATLKSMGEAYKGLTAEVERNLAQRTAAEDAHYAQHQAALEASNLSDLTRLQRETQLLTEHLSTQTQQRQQATRETLVLIDAETQSRLEATRRQGLDDEARRVEVARIEQAMLTAKRQTLDQAVADYRRHIDTLNAEANRHLEEIKRIENEKRQLSLSTAERIREIERAGMTDEAANADRKRQIAELQAAAKTALAQGELETAKGFAQQAMDLAVEVANRETSEALRAQSERSRLEQETSRVTQLEAQARQAAAQGEHDRAKALMNEANTLRQTLAENAKRADSQIIDSKRGVTDAIGEIRTAEGLLIQVLDTEGAAHQKAAQTATTARDAVNDALTATERQIQTISTQLETAHQLKIEADTEALQVALSEIERLLDDREWLLEIEADLTHAKTTLEGFEQLLAEGKTLPVDADVTKARAALDSLKAYAEVTAQADLQLSTEKARSAVADVGQAITALGQLQTVSEHQINSNAVAARREVLALDGLNTSSTHTVYVRKVEQNAIGGLVGQLSGVRGYNRGGPVSPEFPSMRGGTVPGSGNQDTVPRTLEAGAFVLRKAAVQKYGALVQAFARGGSAKHAKVKPSTAAQEKRDRFEAEVRRRELEIEVTRASIEKLKADVAAYTKRPKKIRSERDYLAYWRAFAALRDSIPVKEANLKTQELNLARYRARYERESTPRYAIGGLAPGGSDTVPAMLTPGEYVVRRSAVARFGVGFFEAINRLALPAQAIAARVAGFASGGLVAAGGAMQLPSLSPAGLTTPNRTLRVELVAGNRQVNATIDERDESQLLDLLKTAQARTW